MRIWLALAVSILAIGAGSARAQVIGGESTYEDNFAHTPPAEEPMDTGGKTTSRDRGDAPPNSGASKRRARD